MSQAHMLAMCASYMRQTQRDDVKGYRQHFFAASSPEARERIVRAIGQLTNGSGLPRGASHPVYTKLKPEMAAQIVLGLPVGEGLTTAEKHEWLLSGAEMPPTQWVARSLRWVHPEQINDMAVARWALMVQQDPELIKAAKAPIRKWGNRRLDEYVSDLTAEDVKGETGVNGVIEKIMVRFASTEVGAGMICEPCRHIRESSRIYTLRTAEQLVRAGQTLSNCIGDYKGQVANGDCWIVMIRIGNHLSAAQITKTGEIRQHYSKANSRPHKACELVLRSAINRLKRKQK